MDLGDTLHVAYGDVLAEKLPGVNVLVVREALREGPLSPGPADRMEEFVARRAGFLAMRFGAPELSVREELQRAWQRLAAHAGPIVLHVDAAPCVDCATFVACALSVMKRGRHAGRASGAMASARGGVVGAPLAPARSQRGRRRGGCSALKTVKASGARLLGLKGWAGCPNSGACSRSGPKETRRFRRAAELTRPFDAYRMPIARNEHRHQGSPEWPRVTQQQRQRKRPQDERRLGSLETRQVGSHLSPFFARN